MIIQRQQCSVTAQVVSCQVYRTLETDIELLTFTDQIFIQLDDYYFCFTGEFEVYSTDIQEPYLEASMTGEYSVVYTLPTLSESALQDTVTSKRNPTCSLILELDSARCFLFDWSWAVQRSAMQELIRRVVSYGFTV